MAFLKLFLITIFALSILTPDFSYAQTESRKDLNVTATVPADPDDFIFNISQVTNGSSFAQNSEIQYKIDYESLLSTSTDLTIEAQWYSGVTADQQTTINIVSYVNGSATKAYGNTNPVIDSVNNKISWHISSFPGNQPNFVTFNLITNSNYQGSQVVTFNVKSRLKGTGFTTPDQTVASTYKYNAAPAPSPTPTPALLQLNSIEIRTITNSTAGIVVQTNQPTTTTLKYGTNINLLTNNAYNSTFGLSNSINLSGLKPNTTYYFRSYNTNSSGQMIISDVYSFKTSTSDKTIKIIPNTFIATSNEAILTLIDSFGSDSQVNSNYIVVPVNTVFQFKFALESASNAKSVQAIIRNKNILGLNNLVKKVDASTDLVNMIEVERGIFTGNLLSKPKPGFYEIYVRITEKNGTISEQKLSDLKVTNKLTVKSKNNGKPIEGARILLYILNQQTNKYQLIPDSALANGNPVFTDKTGTIPTVLPPARYKALISEIGFQDKTIEFTIGIGPKENFPIVEMDSAGVSIFRLFRYYFRTFEDILLYNTQIYATSLSDSIRFFDLLSFIILTCLVFLTIFAFSKKHNIPLSSIHTYFFYLWDKKDRNEKYIHGVIYDDKNKPIPLANVYLNSDENEEIVAHVKTNKYGEFYFKKSSLRQKNTDKYMLLVMKKGYKNPPLIKYDEKANVKLKINLEIDSGLEEIKSSFLHSLARIVGLFFELTLLLSFIFELLFIDTFGFVKTAPFLGISLFNLALWTLHLRHKSGTR